MRIIDHRFLTGAIVTLVVLALAMVLTACDRGDNRVPGYDSLIEQVKDNPVGADADQWIEFRNMAGQWERTGLIFGYVDDQGECMKAIAGLREANPAAEYRCTAANIR